jgi:Lrp/AsnC family leucine-responsive transcriptional regulator
MKLGQNGAELDAVDRRILYLLQRNCKLPLAKIGEQVGLSAPSIIERIRRLEERGVIKGYTAVLDARKLGKDVTGFIGVLISHPRLIEGFERAVEELDDVLECHHVTGPYTLFLKVKTADTSSLERLISRIRCLEGVERTETMIVLSTHTERLQPPIDTDAVRARRSRAREDLWERHHRRG